MGAKALFLPFLLSMFLTPAPLFCPTQTVHMVRPQVTIQLPPDSKIKDPFEKKPKPKPIKKITVFYRDPPKWFARSLLDFLYKTCDIGWKGVAVPHMLIEKQIWLESEWHTWAKGKNIDPDTGKVLSTDWNIMQINDGNIAYYVHLYKDADRSERSYDVKHNPYDNMQIGVRRMADMYRVYGSWQKALIAYNGGENVLRHNLKKLKDVTVAYIHIIDPVEKWWDNPPNVILVKQESVWPYRVIKNDDNLVAVRN